MRKISIAVPVLFLVFCLAFASCRAESEAVVRVDNTAPRISVPKYAELEKLYSLDVTEISLFDKDDFFEPYIDFDVDNRMYIFDSYENRMSVFDDRGKLVKRFGRSGQGPKEFSQVSKIRVNKDKIYVFHEITNIKIVNLDGEYISKNLFFIENPLEIRASGDGFFVFRAKVDQTFTKMEFILTFTDDQFSGGRDVFQYQYPPGLSGAIDYKFRAWNWLYVDKDGGFYFPEDNFGKYSIVRYNREGRPKIIFGRPYEIKAYSKEARDRYFSLPGNDKSDAVAKFPASPPVIVKMFQDPKDNLWVISGETYEDNMNPDFENTIDIFSPNGEWLHSLKSKSISRYSLYHNGRIYKVRPFNLESSQQLIDVYQIVYAK